MNLYATIESEKGKQATKGGQKQINIELLNADRERIANINLYFIVGHKIPQLDIWYSGSRLEQAPYIHDSEDIPY